MRKKACLFLQIITCLYCAQANASPVYLNATVNVSDVHINSWKQQRDRQVVKQNYDFSCGSAALSTVLTYFYQNPVSEQEILANIQLKDVMMSFLNLQTAANHFGFQAKGLATNYDTLAQLKIPAIVYLNHRRSDHFSVVRAIDKDNVYLADSIWGNRKLTRQQFESMWHTRNDAKLKGRVLLILPKNPLQQKSHKSFVNKPPINKLKTEIIHLNFEQSLFAP